MKKACTVRFSRLPTLGGFDPFIRSLALKRSVEIDCGHYVGDEFPFSDYAVETGSDSDVVTKRA